MLNKTHQVNTLSTPQCDKCDDSGGNVNLYGNCDGDFESVKRLRSKNHSSHGFSDLSRFMRIASTEARASLYNYAHIYDIGNSVLVCCHTAR